MMDKEGTDGEQDTMKAYKAAREEIDDSTNGHVPDGASSALINRMICCKNVRETLMMYMQRLVISGECSIDDMLQKREKDIDDVHAKIGDKWRVLD
nr:hypothetical protein [Tanacetum cinerariifolium]